VAVKGNTATFEAGGIYSEEGPLFINDSTVPGNSVISEIGGVGGVEKRGGIANIINSTISGNQAAGFGGGVLANTAGTSISIRNSTITSNTSGRQGGGISSAFGTSVLVLNSIVAGNSLDDCANEPGSIGVSSQGNNVSSDDSCGFTKSTDKQSTNPRLGPLQDNGGPTDTRALLPGSPAIDAGLTGANSGCPATDQRGVRRPQGPRCDIGAFEKRNSSPVARNDSYRGVEDKVLKVPAPGVLKNDTDPDGDALKAKLVSVPGKGKLSLGLKGGFTYTPRKNFNGTAKFAYQASDGRGGSDRAVVTLRVTARSG